MIVTASLGVLKRERIRFAPLLPERKLGAIRRLGFGVLNKVNAFSQRCQHESDILNAQVFEDSVSVCRLLRTTLLLHEGYAVVSRSAFACYVWSRILLAPLILKVPANVLLLHRLPSCSLAGIIHAFNGLPQVVMLFERDFWGGADMFGRLAPSTQERGKFFLFYSYSGISGTQRPLNSFLSVLP